MKLELRKFDMSKLKDDSVVVIIGARNTGKTVALMDMLRHHTQIPIGVVISGTESANHNFERIIPKMLIYDEYTPEVINKFLDRQKKICAQHFEETKKYGRTDLDPRAFLILDDCLYDKSWINDKNIRYIFLNGRHQKCFLIITMQFTMGIPPHLRANVDYVFIMRNNMIKEREKLFNQYAGMFPNFHVFNKVMDQCTANYDFLVIDKKSQSNRLQDQVFWYKADMKIDYKMCSKELWEIQRKNDEMETLGYKNEDEGEEEFDNEKMVVKKKNGMPDIKVKKSQYTL
jgi:hypothetical protein